MSIVKSFSVGDGDMFYIKHGSDSFTTIDCCLSRENKKVIMDEIVEQSKEKGITRFISTHPDEDHLSGLEYYDSRMKILNFYCVNNVAIKQNESDSFKKYCDLRDSNKVYYLKKGCTRKWLNDEDNERGSAGIKILWPDISNESFKAELNKVNKGEKPNNISPIIKYSTGNATFLWMGDLETEFMEKVADDLDLSEVSILFAPHHGRESGRVPDFLLQQLAPKIIVIGEAPSENLDYYSGYNTITQNSAGDIIFLCEDNNIHIYVSDSGYDVDYLDYNIDYSNPFRENGGSNYIGTLLL